jgi:hypothetical protein
MSGKGDGRFHGDKVATRYDVAVGLAKAVAEFENRLSAEGRNPEDIVPYIERINLYVADELDHLKQGHKELRAAVNEILERLDRRDPRSNLPPVPSPPMTHPHKGLVPHTELRDSGPTHGTQRVYTGVLGAAPVHPPPAGARIGTGILGAAPILDSPGDTIAFAGGASGAGQGAPVKGRIPSDEIAWGAPPDPGAADGEDGAATIEDGAGSPLAAAAKATPGATAKKGKRKGKGKASVRAKAAGAKATGKTAAAAGHGMAAPAKAAGAKATGPAGAGHRIDGKRRAKPKTKTQATQPMPSVSAEQPDATTGMASGAAPIVEVGAAVIEGGANAEPSDEQLSSWKASEGSSTEPAAGEDQAADGEAAVSPTARASTLLSQMRSRFHRK